MRGVALATAALAATALLSLPGCDRRDRSYAGIGTYQVGKTTLADASGRCEPTELPDERKGTWCYLQPALTIASRPADVDLYFLGETPDAPMIELQLDVRGCEPDRLSLWLRERFGAPRTSTPTWSAWENRKLYLIAESPTDTSRCLIRVLPRSEQAEFERLRTKAGVAAAP